MKDMLCELGQNTRAAAKRLRKMIRKNGDALLRTAPLIVEAIEDDDGRFALEELSNAESQLRGLRQMLEHARDLKIALVGEEDDWPREGVQPRFAEAEKHSTAK